MHNFCLEILFGELWNVHLMMFLDQSHSHDLKTAFEYVHMFCTFQISIFRKSNQLTALKSILKIQDIPYTHPLFQVHLVQFYNFRFPEI